MSATTRIDLDIAGMSCGHCVAAIREALGELDGVQVDAVAVGSASVVIDDARVTFAAVADAIRDAGYEARIPDDRH